jgi:hypothetical protein
MSQASPSRVATLAPRIRPPSGMPPAGNTNAAACHELSVARAAGVEITVGRVAAANCPCSQRTGTEPTRVLPSKSTPERVCGSLAISTTVRASFRVPHDPTACQSAAVPLKRTTPAFPKAASTFTSCGRPKTRSSVRNGLSPVADLHAVTSLPDASRPPS